jgi:hypothetical protein
MSYPLAVPVLILPSLVWNSGNRVVCADTTPAGSKMLSTTVPSGAVKLRCLYCATWAQ